MKVLKWCGKNKVWAYCIFVALLLVIFGGILSFDFDVSMYIPKWLVICAICFGFAITIAIILIFYKIARWVIRLIR